MMMRAASADSLNSCECSLDLTKLSVIGKALTSPDVVINDTNKDGSDRIVKMTKTKEKKTRCVGGFCLGAVCDGRACFCLHVRMHVRTSRGPTSNSDESV